MKKNEFRKQYFVLKFFFLNQVIIHCQKIEMNDDYEMISLYFFRLPE